MIVVSDTTPLNYLILIESAHVLPAQMRPSGAGKSHFRDHSDMPDTSGMRRRRRLTRSLHFSDTETIALLLQGFAASPDGMSTGAFPVGGGGSEVGENRPSASDADFPFTSIPHPSREETGQDR